jgi:hypothetical protein
MFDWRKKAFPDIEDEGAIMITRMRKPARTTLASVPSSGSSKDVVPTAPKGEYTHEKRTGQVFLH